MAITIVLLLTAPWHFLAFWHFTFHPTRTLARISKERPVSPAGAEAVRFLGGINAGFVVLALATIALPQAMRWPALLALTAANLSQLVVDLRALRLGLAQGSYFRQIVVGDAIFTVANAIAVVTCLV